MKKKSNIWESNLNSKVLSTRYLKLHYQQPLNLKQQIKTLSIAVLNATELSTKNLNSQKKLIPHTQSLMRRFETKSKRAWALRTKSNSCIDIAFQLPIKMSQKVLSLACKVRMKWLKLRLELEVHKNDPFSKLDRTIYVNHSIQRSIRSHEWSLIFINDLWTNQWKRPPYL